MPAPSSLLFFLRLPLPLVSPSFFQPLLPPRLTRLPVPPLRQSYSRVLSSLQALVDFFRYIKYLYTGDRVFSPCRTIATVIAANVIKTQRPIFKVADSLVSKRIFMALYGFYRSLSDFTMSREPSPPRLPSIAFSRSFSRLLFFLVLCI